MARRFFFEFFDIAFRSGSSEFFLTEETISRTPSRFKSGKEFSILGKNFSWATIQETALGLRF